MRERSHQARLARADGTFLDEVLGGLRSVPKTLPPKFFYDDRGARLFEEICRQPEYYLTRAELEILREAAPEIARLAGAECALVEYGSGAGVKVRLLLDALHRPVSYVPVDISRRQLAQVAASIGRDYPALAVDPVCADYTRRFEVPDVRPRARRLAFFPGSTIGNFHPFEATAFLQRVRRVIGPGGAMVLGVDRRKDPRTLHAAYDDAAGVTAAFNLNLLARLNRELDAGFDLALFAHRVRFDDAAGRVEMHLESLARQTVRIAGQEIRFERGETIWTESSYKYDREALDAVVGAAGFRVERLFTDAREQFWVAWLTAGDPRAG